MGHAVVNHGVGPEAVPSVFNLHRYIGLGDTGVSKNMQEFAAVHGARPWRLARQMQLGPQHLCRTDQLHFRRLFVGQTAPGLGQHHSAVSTVGLAMKVVDFGPFGIGKVPAYSPLNLAHHLAIGIKRLGGKRMQKIVRGFVMHRDCLRGFVARSCAHQPIADKG